MIQSIFKVKDDIFLSLGQTFYMVLISVVIGIVFGILIGLLLYTSENPLFVKNKFVNKLVGFLINIIQSVPFLILMVLLLPLSKVVVGTKIGSKAVLVPLSIAAIAFFARLSQASFSDVSKGVIEAFISTGAGKAKIILKILIPEALPSLVRNITVTTVAILGFSAMAGLVGGGGLGDLAYRYGYQRYQSEVMIVCVLILIVLVQGIQFFGEWCVKKVSKK
ncbi:MAG: ABC transporter permease [Treponema sp.]|nr:ABC transporter permease [Treponema sp.]